MARVAINAELAGLFPTQKPGNESNIPTFASPPYLGLGIVVVADGVDVVEAGVLLEGVDVEVSVSGASVVVGMVVVTSTAVVSEVVESEHEAATREIASKNPAAFIFF